MQEQDVNTKEYFLVEERVADLINGGLLEGQQIVKAADVKDADSSVFGRIAWFGRWTTRQRYRDIVRKVMFGTRFVIIGIEEQSEIHDAMPVRTMGYDFIGYDTQLKKIGKRHRLKKNLRSARSFLSGMLPGEKLEPVITIVLYFGEEEWTGPRCLHDMLALQDFPEALRKYVNDYQLHIFEVNRFKHLEYFQTDLRLVLGFLQNHSNQEMLKKFIKENETELGDMEEDAYNMITELSHSEELVQLKKKYGKEGKIDMCKGLRDWMAEERKAGEESGEERGEARFASLTERLLKESRTEDLLKATTNEKYRKTLYKEFRL